MTRRRDRIVRELLWRRPSTLLRAAVFCAAAAVLSAPITVAAGVAAAMIGSFGGVVAAEEVGRRAASGPRLRVGSVALLALALAAAGTGLSRLAVGSAWLASALGPVAAIRWSEALMWLFLSAPLVFALRFAASRHPVASVLEMVAVGAAYVSCLAAHREGMVHRPFPVGDFAWTRGIDPAVVFLVLGGLSVFLLAALLVEEERKRRLPLHFGGLAAVALLLLLFVRVSGLPEPQVAGDLGLTGEPEQGEGQTGRAGGNDESGSRSDQLTDLQFRDEYAASGGKAPVAVVLLHDDYSPPSGVYYFRQSAFSQYNGRRLVQTTRDDVDRDIVNRFPSEPIEVPGAPPASPARRLLHTTTGLLIDHVKPFALDSPATIEPAQNPNTMRFQRAFEAQSLVQTLPYEAMLGGEPGDAGWTDSQWDYFTEAPSDPRYAEAAASMVAVLRDDFRNDPLAQALAIKIYLDENGTYSRKSTHAGADDPAASFLFGDLTGYCVHFAHAAVYLMRSLGIPARVAAGYAVPERDRAGGSAIMIRGLNAHAWPEIYLGGVGWVVVDPAPQRTLDEVAAAPSPELQRMLGEMMRGRSGRKTIEDEPLIWRLTPSDVLRVLLAVAVALALLSAAVKLYRFGAPWIARPAGAHRASYRAALDRLAEVGVHRRFGESRERFAERASAVAPSFELLTRAHLRGALGFGALLLPEALRRLNAAIARERRLRIPAWRRLLGTCNPFSWWWAR